MAARISCEGRVTVSERRSIGAIGCCMWLLPMIQMDRSVARAGFGYRDGGHEVGWHGLLRCGKTVGLNHGERMACAFFSYCWRDRNFRPPEPVIEASGRRWGRPVVNILTRFPLALCGAHRP